MIKNLTITTILTFFLPFNLFAQSILQIGSFSVTNNNAVIKLPIVHQKQYTWYHANSPDDVAEYICSVEFGRYSLGFSLYKYSGSIEKTGDIKELLSAGQSDIGEKEGESFVLVTKHKVSISFLESSSLLILEISNPDTIKMLFSDKPEKASFQIQGFQSYVPEGKLDIRY